MKKKYSHFYNSSLGLYEQDMRETFGEDYQSISYLELFNRVLSQTRKQEFASLFTLETHDDLKKEEFDNIFDLTFNKSDFKEQQERVLYSFKKYWHLLDEEQLDLFDKEVLTNLFENARRMKYFVVGRDYKAYEAALKMKRINYDNHDYDEKFIINDNSESFYNMKDCALLRYFAQSDYFVSFIEQNLYEKSKTNILLYQLNEEYRDYEYNPTILSSKHTDKYNLLSRNLKNFKIRSNPNMKYPIKNIADAIDKGYLKDFELNIHLLNDKDAHDIYQKHKDNHRFSKLINSYRNLKINQSLNDLKNGNIDKEVYENIVAELSDTNKRKVGMKIV